MADGADSEVAVADAVHDAIGDPVDPPHEPGEQPTEAIGWDLLDKPNTYGECDGQAILMQYIVELLGLEAEVKFVRASTNAGTDNCLHWETRMINNRKAWLVMDFDTSEDGHNWNFFEACCVTADFYYAIWPKIKATDDYDVLKKLGCQQYWVYSFENLDPDLGFGLDEAGPEVGPPVPIPELD